MAIEPKDEYPAQTIDSDPDYPHGKARNVTVPGDGTGTPLEQRWVNDLWGFLQRLLTLGSVTPSGVPDNASASDYADALLAWLAGIFVSGPASATDNRIARFDGGTGKLVKSSPVSISDDGDVSGVDALSLSGEPVYATGKPRTILIDPVIVSGSIAALTPEGWRLDSFGTGPAAQIFNPTTDVILGSIDLSPYLRTGMVLEELEVAIDPGVANAANGDRMSFELNARPWGYYPGVTPTQLGQVYDSGANADQTRTVFSGSHTVDRETYSYRLGLKNAKNGSSKVYSIRMTVTDPGPRNF